MTTEKNNFHFDLETQPRKINDQQWDITLSPHWNININPNGGYLLACLLKTMASTTPDHPDPVAVTTHYLRPGLSDKKAIITADIIRIGKRTATVTGTLTQEGKQRITTTATFGNTGNKNDAGNENKNERSLIIAAPDIPGPGQCIDRSELAQGVELGILSRVEVRVDPQYAEPGKASKANMAGWIRFKDKRPTDVWALPVFCDAFPPSIFSLYGRIGWVPTVELSVHIRQRPQPGWVKALFTTRDIAGDLFIEDGLLWDETDQLIAQSRQLQMILEK